MRATPSTTAAQTKCGSIIGKKCITKNVRGKRHKLPFSPHDPFRQVSTPASSTLAAMPAIVAIRAPGNVQRVFVTFAAIKYTDIV